MSDIGLEQAGRLDKNLLVHRLGGWPYALTILLSASLVFLVQPMFAKMATPLLGGSPSVWNVSLVCFQAALLGGYAYAHLLARIKRIEWQVGIHGVLLLAAALVLPLSISGLFGNPDPSQPILWLAGTFLVSIAPPFALISATAPLVQNWYSKSGREDAADPYHLYAASNIGSLIGLALYPLAMEPLATLSQQAGIWAIGYGFLALMLCASGMLAWMSSKALSPTLSNIAASVSESAASAPAQSKWMERLVWLALAFVPSSLLVGVTTHISTDVAASPFLWAPPLMVYIGSFIIVFAKKPPLSTKTTNRYLPYAIFASAIFVAMPSLAFNMWTLLLGVHIATLFFVSVALHGQLVERRPSADRLTEFYLIMSLGGVLGSAFNALLAPVIFTSVIEYPLMLVIALALRHVLISPKEDFSLNRYILAGLLGVALIGMVLTLSETVLPQGLFRILAVILLVIGFMGRMSRWVPAAVVTTIMLMGSAVTSLGEETSARGFFGTVKTKVAPNGDVRYLVHGTTIHGAQLMEDMDADRPMPLTYYHADAAIGQAITSYIDDADTVGVVGLGVGATACYSQPGQSFKYYEIDPLVAEVATDEDYFTFLSACTPGAPIILGDARITLAEEASKTFDILLLDAFSSDAIPAHLLTREAMALYLDRLTDDGVLVFHISNRHLALAPTLARIGHSQNAYMVHQKFNTPLTKDPRDPASTEVVVLAKSEAVLQRLKDTGNWTALEADDKTPWSDDYSNIIGAMLEAH